jgi:hypothetical protein
MALLTALWCKPPESDPSSVAGGVDTKAGQPNSEIISSCHQSYFRSIMPPSICKTWPVVYVLTMRKM